MSIPYEIRNALEQDYLTINELAVEAWQVLKPGYDPGQWDGMLAAIGNMSNLAAKRKLEKTRDIHDKFCQGENGDFP